MRLTLLRNVTKRELDSAQFGADGPRPGVWHVNVEYPRLQKTLVPVILNGTWLRAEEEGDIILERNQSIVRTEHSANWRAHHNAYLYKATSGFLCFGRRAALVVILQPKQASSRHSSPPRAQVQLQLADSNLLYEMDAPLRAVEAPAVRAGTSGPPASAGWRRNRTAVALASLPGHYESRRSGSGRNV